MGSFGVGSNGWVLGGDGLYVRKRKSLKTLFEVALADETLSSTSHRGNGLVSVTFISLSVEKSFTIVVFFVLLSEMLIMSALMNKLTWQPPYWTPSRCISLMLFHNWKSEGVSYQWWNLLIFHLTEDLKPISVSILVRVFLSKPKNPTSTATSVINEPLLFI